MLTSQEVKDYLGIDYTDEQVEANIIRIIKTADGILKGSIGEEYNPDDPRAVELALIICADLYDNRELKDRVSGNVRKLVEDMSWQLRLELRRSKNEV